MQIWVDADACPRAIKDILYRAAERVSCALILVANQSLSVPKSLNIRAVRVAPGFDIADSYIEKHVMPGDLVITADIPLAADVLAKEAYALNPRGEMYDANSIRQKLTLRDFMDEMRGSGIVTGGPPPLSQGERRTFANALDRFLAQSATP